MQRFHWSRHVATLGVLLTATSLAQHAAAQNRNPLAPRPEVHRDAEPPPVASGSIVWPRLDPGATFCRTQDDLRRRSEAEVASAAGTDMLPGTAPDCRTIALPTGIDILDRASPSATQVRLKLKPAPGTTASRPGETGWTNTWLPEKAPTR